jgi:hypothetical protein
VGGRIFFRGGRADFFLIKSPNFIEHIILIWKMQRYLFKCDLAVYNKNFDFPTIKVKKRIESKKYHTFGTFPKSNRKIVETRKSLPLTQYMTVHFTVKVAGIS